MIMKHALIDPVTLTFNFSTSKTTTLLEYIKAISYIKFEHYRNFQFWVMIRINKQTASNILPMPTHRVGVVN